MMPALLVEVGLLTGDNRCRRRLPSPAISAAVFFAACLLERLVQHFSFGRAACVAYLAPLFAAIGDFVEM
jgi:hypothetical protein